MGPDHRQYRSIKERADQLGISPAAIRLWVNKRKIGHARFGRAIRISDEDVRQFVARNTVAVLGPDGRAL
jgi:excisionase family DNA binding protein